MGVTYFQTAAAKMNRLEDQVTDLRNRLDQGAEEYKKVYVEKCKAEKKLTKSVTKKGSSVKDSSSKESLL